MPGPFEPYHKPQQPFHRSLMPNPFTGVGPNWIDDAFQQIQPPRPRFRCRIGWHRWGLWEPIRAPQYVSGEGQRRACFDCGLGEDRSL